MSLTPDVEKHLHSVLDQGIDFLANSDVQIPPHTSSMQSLLDQQYPASIRQSSGTLETILAEPKPEVKATHGEYEVKTQVLQEELQSLQKKISALETKLKTSSKLPSTSSIVSHPTASPKTASPRTRETPKHKKASTKPHKDSFAAKAENVQSDLEDERKTILDLHRENEALRQQLNRHGNVLAKLAEVQEDYNALAVSYDKSERLRKKQKELIDKLRSELAKTPQTNQGRRNVRSRSGKKDTSRTRSSSKKTVRFRK